MASLDGSPSSEAAELLALLEEWDRRQSLRRFYTFYPEDGPLSRFEYPKHCELFALGSAKPFRLAIGGNGIGKTEGIGSFETTCHATGLYPEWWTGKRYDKATDIVVAGQTKENVRDIIQPKLIGRRGHYGTGMIPGELIVGEPKLRQGGNDAVDFVYVRHVSGGLSRIGFKSYDQGQEAFMGFEADFIWLDEEPPPEIYSECVQRFRTREPSMLITFTPLDGISDVVSMFLPQYAQEYDEATYEASGRAFVMISQDEVPHLTDEERKRMQANALPHEREARRNGVPSIGSGKIYPVEESSFVIPILSGGIPRHWPRMYGLDVGLNCTAAVFLARDLDTDTVYIYAEHYVKDQLPAVHAAAIKARGDWMHGVIDPSARNRNASDGESLLKRYSDLGLNLHKADNAVTEGLTEVLDRLQTGRLKVFETCTNWIREFRLYRRDDKQRIVKINDHAMDACVTGDTLVMVDAGPVAIADLVGKRGRVVSRCGAVQDFIGARMTMPMVPIVELKFSDGKTVRCTPDHPFLTESGWVRADRMAGRSCFNGVAQRDQRALWTSRLFRPFARNTTARGTTCVASISNAMASGSTEGCGKTPTERLFRMGLRCITSITTGRTTIQATWRSCGEAITRAITSLGMVAAFLGKPSMQLASGTAQIQGANGTGSTTKSMPERFISTRSSIASTAARVSPLRSQAPTSSALPHAGPGRVARLALTMSNVLAWFAAAALWRIATLRKPAARASAQVFCQSVSDAGSADVYCLTVPGSSAFCLANGAVVHNTRYALRGLKHATISAPPKPKITMTERDFGIHRAR